MKIVQLRAENYARLRAVEITPTGDVVQITGANGHGKTSVLNAIWEALEHTRVDTAQPIHKGAKKASIRLNLGEVVVERTFTPKGSTLTVTAPDGVKVSSPQTFLSQLVGELSFDPLAFDRMKPREQFDQLRHVVKVTVDFDDLDRQNKVDFERRAELNRQAKAKRAQAEGIPIPDGNPIAEADIIERINGAHAENEKLSARRLKRQAVQKNAEEHEARAFKAAERIEQLTNEIRKLKEECAASMDESAAARRRLAEAEPLPEPVDVSGLTQELVRVQEHNRRWSEWEKRRALEAEASDLEGRAAQLTDAMDGRVALKQKAIESAQMPIEGIGFGDGVVLYNGVPFSQASSAERLRVSLAIAMAANPKIRVIRIQDGSLLDSKSMAMIGDLARDKDYQVWIEVVDETKKIGIVIEDGIVAAVNDEQ